MASTTITVSKSTNTNAYAPSQVYGLEAWPYSTCQSKDSRGTTYHEWYAYLQFIIPNNLKYKTITSARLQIYVEGGISTGGYIDEWGSKIYIAAYNTGDTLAQISHSNRGQYGTLTESKLIGNEGTIHYPTWRYLDILDLFVNNRYTTGGTTYFTVVLEAMPGFPDFQHTEIGGAGSDVYAAKLILDYEDAPQLAPSPSYPNNVYVDENTDILFSWAWNSSTAAVQASVQLEYKLASAANYTVVSLTQSAHTYKLVGGLPQGVYNWRIKGTNDIGETSGYSEVATFTVVGAPALPVINTPANRALTEITWNTTDQNSFDITITDSNGNVVLDETVASSASSYKPNIFLKGSYTVGIRTRNSTGLSSGWAYKAFSITAAGPAKPSLTLYADSTIVYGDITPASGVKYALIRRREDPDGPEEIVQTEMNTSGQEFADRTFKFYVPYRYVLRAYTDNGGYTDSDPVRICHGLKAVVLHSVDDELILKVSQEVFLPYTEDATCQMAIYKVVGRDYPVVEHDIFQTWQFTSSLYVTEDEKERLKKMAKKDIYYRDYSGRSFPVAISSINFDRFQDTGYIATIQFTRVTGEDVIVNV